jgi:membrane protein DedA with SNARE-associated domain
MLETLNHAFGLTYLILWAAVCARQVCLPVPANLFLLTAGALVHRGEVNIGLVMSMGVLGCLSGDLLWFEAGRRWGRQILRILCGHSRHSRDGVCVP